MGTGLSQRRGMLRKPAECKPGPPPIIIVGDCVCSLRLTGLPPPYFLRAEVLGCRLFSEPGMHISVVLSSMPPLSWLPAIDPTNCAGIGTYYSDIATPGTFYRVYASLTWSDFSTCNAEATIVYSPP